MAERNTTTGKKESKLKGSKVTKAKDEASKTPAKRGRPRKVRPAEADATENEPVDETGVKLYNPKTGEVDAPFSFDSEYSRPGSLASAEPAASVEPVAGQPDEPEATFITAPASLMSVQEEGSVPQVDSAFAFVSEEPPAT